ncbi:hypothetical protein [Streptomyces sp. NPDC004230]
MFLPRTVYALACDDCGGIYRLPDFDTDNDSELHLLEQELAPALVAQIEANGWIVGHNHRCAACAIARGTALIKHLAFEAANQPLFELSDLPGCPDHKQEP